MKSKFFKSVFNAIFITISVNASYIRSGIDVKKLPEKFKNSHRILNPSNYNINPNTQLNALLPSSFDLRNVDGMNFISPAKDQGDSGWCWVFSGIAAVEASAQFELWNEYGISPDELPIDFSELQMGWFAFTALQANETTYQAQKGEGIYTGDGVNILDVGGNMSLFMSLLASGVGPFDEEEIPFINKSGNTLWVQIDENGKIKKDENNNKISEIHPLDWEAPSDFKPYNIVVDGEDWSVDIKNRFNSKLRLEHANNLPCPATYDENDNYQFDQVGLDALRQELNLGHAIEIAYYGEFPDFDDLDNPPKFINRNFAQYTYDESFFPDHVITIVGYDDNYSVDNFLQVDSKGNNIAPPADGAFICKNSWGTKDDEFYSDIEFGVNGTGIFYLSYYDKSLTLPTSYDFSLVELTEHDDNFIPVIDQHDLLPADGGWDVYHDEDVIAMSNIFTPGRNELLQSISTYVFVPNTIVEYDVYILNRDYNSPTDGVLFASGSQNVVYAGYHLFELETSIYIESTKSYSIVIRQKDNEGNYYFGFICNMSKEFYDIYNSYAEDEEMKVENYSIAVVNKGESFIYRNGKWDDETEIIPYFNSYNFINPTNGEYIRVENGLAIDNFSIKGYAITNKLLDIPTTTNTISDGSTSTEITIDPEPTNDGSTDMHF